MPGIARLYLVTPQQPDLARLPARLARLLERFDIACVRLAATGQDETALARAAEALLPVCRTGEVPLLIADHFRLVGRLGLDGVHLGDGARQVRAAREVLGREAIVGAHAGCSRHDGMTAAEIGADYVSFGPLTPSALGDGRVAPPELFQWWSEMIEVPVVAEGGLDEDLVATLSPHADFLAMGEEIWASGGDPETTLARLAEPLTAR